MRYILFVEMAGFYVRTLGLEDQAAVIHDGPRLIDVSARARERKVTLNRTLQEAKLLLQGGGVFVPYHPEEFESASARWYDLLAHYSGTIEPLSPSTALVDLSRHPKPSEVAALLLAALYRLERLSVRAGIASSVWLARCSAAICERVALELGLLPIEPVEDGASWLAQKPIASLTPLPPEVRIRLERLGLRRVKDVQALPYAALQQQFRKLAPFIQAVALGRHFEPVAAAWPPNTLSIDARFERCEDREQLDSALKTLARDAASELSNGDRVAGGMDCYLTLESGAVQSARRLFKHPTQAALALLTHLKQAVDGFEIVEPVVAVRLHLAKLAASQRRQAVIAFDNRRTTDDVETVVGRLQTALGTGAVVKASTITQSREKRVLKAWKEAYGWI